jgi:hypothetical protein
MAIYIFSLMNFVINNHENFQTHSIIYSINKKNKHHLHRPNANPSFYQKSTLYAGNKIFNSSPCSLIILKYEKAKFKVSLGKYLNTHSFHSVDECFVLGWSIILFCKMFIVFDSVKIVYICVFMTCSTPYCLCGTLIDPRNVHVCVCVCVCVVCINVCMYVCI